MEKATRDRSEPFFFFKTQVNRRGVPRTCDAPRLLEKKNQIRSPHTKPDTRSAFVRAGVGASMVFSRDYVQFCATECDVGRVPCVVRLGMWAHADTSSLSFPRRDGQRGKNDLVFFGHRVTAEPKKTAGYGLGVKVFINGKTKRQFFFWFLVFLFFGTLC